MHRRRCLGLHHEARRHRTAPQSHAGMAVPVEQDTKRNLAGPPVSYDADLERLEIELLLEGIYRHYGFDFRSYAFSSVRRRLWKRMESEGLTTISELQAHVLHDPESMERLLLDLSVNVTSMFR